MTDKSFLVAYGSQTGTVQDYAENIYLEATMKGFRTRIITLNDLYSEFPPLERQIVMLISNTGDGDPPDNAVKFWKWIHEDPYPQGWEGLRVALLGFGDSNYTTYNNTGKTLNVLLPKLGTSWLVRSAFCDANAGNDLVADPWFEHLWDVLEGRSLPGITSSGPSTEDITEDLSKLSMRSDNILSTDYQFWKLPIMEGISEESFDINSLPKLHPLTVAVSPFPLSTIPLDTEMQRSPSTGYKSPILARNVTMQPLTAPDAVKAVISVKFTVDDARWSCQAGDAFGLICKNDRTIVYSFLKLLNLNPDTKVFITPLVSSPPPESLLEAIINRSMTLFELFLNHVDIMQFPKKAFLRHLAEFCDNESDRLGLLYLSSKVASKDYMSLAAGHANIMDFLYTFKSCKPSLECLLSNLSLLHPRFYSVCSASKSSRVEFIYSSITFNTPDGGSRKGVCSNWLDDCLDRLHTDASGASMEFHVFPRPSPHFRLPDDLDIPIIMVGAGTGISPFIGFIRSETKLRRMMWLIYGFRDRTKDFLFHDELEKSLHLSRLTIATSREPNSGHPKYVQDAIRDHSLEIYSLMMDQKALIYICGDELNMIKDVNNCIQEMIAEHGKMSFKDAQTKFNEWNAAKRIIRDVWV